MEISLRLKQSSVVFAELALSKLFKLITSRGKPKTEVLYVDRISDKFRNHINHYESPRMCSCRLSASARMVRRYIKRGDAENISDRAYWTRSGTKWKIVMPSGRGLGDTNNSTLGNRFARKKKGTVKKTLAFQRQENRSVCC